MLAVTGYPMRRQLTRCGKVQQDCGSVCTYDRESWWLLHFKRKILSICLDIIIGALRLDKCLEFFLILNWIRRLVVICLLFSIHLDGRIILRYYQHFL